MNLGRGRKAAVIGLGKSGYEAALLLAELGSEVWVTDRKENPSLRRRLFYLKKEGIKGEIGRHTLAPLLASELIVLSPGVDRNQGWIKKLLSHRKRVMGELNLALSLNSIPTIAVTGTNGKSTTVCLLHHFLKGKALLGGNIGIPLSYLVRKKKKGEWIILEVSSFQLEDLQFFHPQIAVLLNITSDHLDRYPSFQEYEDTKWKIFSPQTPDDFAVVNLKVAGREEREKSIKSKMYFFSLTPHQHWGTFIKEGSIFFRDHRGEEKVCSLKGWGLPGKHNLENLLASVCVVKLCGLPNSLIQERIKTFRGLPHRLEKFIQWRGITFIDDSKATTVDSLRQALLSLPPPLILIMGGRDKGSDFSSLSSLVKKKVKLIIAIGECREKIVDTFTPLVRVETSSGMEEAVHTAFKFSREGDTVLLSPACSSLDMFSDYRERGRVFKEMVREEIERRKDENL